MGHVFNARAKMLAIPPKAAAEIVGIASLEIIFVALFSFLLGTYLTKQLLTLKEASHTIAISGPGHQIPIIGNDEISDVAHAFNDMSSTLNEVLAEREKILSDLALLNKEKDQRADELILANKELPTRTAARMAKEIRLTSTQTVPKGLNNLYSRSPSNYGTRLLP